MKSKDIREAFLAYFESKQHTRVDSSSLVPAGDNTLLFANAGMNQFKEIFTGESSREYNRATSSQKCVRAGGKHNDLENVGVTARHNTFFEMLGNFSFGDYFKKDAISFAWEFLTEDMKLPKDKLWITVHDSDDEAEKLWLDITEIDPSRVHRMGDKDNFWSMGETGPCGPCSEVHIDQGADVGCQRPECDLFCDCDRYLEIWNLVFMQFEQKADGTREALPNPCIDTGMGLERLCAVANNKPSSYDTDLFTPLTDKVAEICGAPYDRGDKGVSHRVLADHAKTTTFLINDGIFPSNEGRGYVLRRIMRRAIRHAYMLGYKEPILCQLQDVVNHIYGEAYPSLIKNSDKIKEMIKDEEERFLKTVDQGIQLYEKNKKNWQKNKSIPGKDAFTLYDTYGFPLDLTQQMAEEDGLQVDEKGFEEHMSAQREKAREASMFKTSYLQGLHWENINEGEQTFSGYDTLTLKSSILKKAVTSEGQHLLVPEKCVFYGESGGQVGDHGYLVIQGNTIDVVDTQIVDGNRVLVLDKNQTNLPDLADGVEQFVDHERRQLTAINHTCTHLLHKALKETIGDRAEQRGSWVGPTHLRFDFPHTKPVSAEELKEVEEKVNVAIQQNREVNAKITSLDAAKAEGVTALFGEKYGNEVRVVNISSESKELCGGTHLDHTGKAIAFVIRSESSIASGIRRIEAITGPTALNHLMETRAKLNQLASVVQAPAEELEGRFINLKEENSDLKKELGNLQGSLILNKLDDKLRNPDSINEIPYLAEAFDNVNAKSLRETVEEIRKLRSDICIFLASNDGNKVSLTLSFPKNLVKAKNANAGKSLKEIASHVKGGGGGSPEFAQAGGSDSSGIPQAIDAFKETLKGL